MPSRGRPLQWAPNRLREINVSTSWCAFEPYSGSPDYFGRSKRPAIQYSEHLTGDGSTVFDHVCRMGLEGIVSKRVDSRYRSGPSRVWVKSKNPASEAVRPERKEDWH